ncbi:MAG: NAD/NADP octopine/nopaline dehydrogenase family protein [Candidatus Bathyarchaeia archaeon]
MKQPVFAVCGAGRAGTTMAADMALMGYKVNLFELDRFRESIEPIMKRGGVELSGKTQSGKTGFAKLNKITTDPREAIDGADLILIAAPAIGHEPFFDALSPFLKDGQCVLVNTGCWASLRMAPMLRKRGVFDKITLGEAHIMPYLSDKKGYTAHIFNVKQDLKLATFPGDRKSKLLEIAKLTYPQYRMVPNVLWTNFGSGNPSVHCPIALPMAGLMLERNEATKFYGEVTACAARLSEAFDRERKAVAKAYGCVVEGELESVKKEYGYTGKDIAEAYRNSIHAERLIPKERIKVILEEDLKFLYVPFVELGKLAGIPTPVTSGMVDVLGTILNVNYWETGVTLEDLGFAGLKVDQIVEYVNTGMK